MEKIDHKRRAFVYKGRKIYEWDQTLEEVNFYTTAPPGITAREIACKIQTAWLTLGAASAQHPFIDEALFSRANVSESFWTLEDGVIHIMVTKAKPGEIWLAFLKNHAPAAGGGEAQVLEQAIRKELMLERFQSENPGFDFSGATFNGAAPDPTTFLK